jgi:hypothetical protein
MRGLISTIEQQQHPFGQSVHSSGGSLKAICPLLGLYFFAIGSKEVSQLVSRKNVVQSMIEKKVIFFIIDFFNHTGSDIADQA